MRPSQRTAVLDAAMTLISAEEGANITLDAVARQAGMTKPGLMYHFPTRDALLLAIVEHAARRVEDAMLATLAVPFDQATPAARIRAYARVAYGGDASRAEYAVAAEAAYRPALSGPWVGRLAKWFDLPPDLPPTTRARLTLARLAADGLWSAFATGLFPPEPQDRDALVALIEDLTAEGDVS
ncbi:TetR family transcriptional regulator [Micromonospora sp. NBC_01740]|uniref:TetR family transcriptional regulator n=2 Tax=unclassified Micromonospora TaxID=2617518 RepID=UPI002E13CF69|nr:TetR family transcriptional regulator [Micromonospora sp. NBC_01740]